MSLTSGLAVIALLLVWLILCSIAVIACRRLLASLKPPHAVRLPQESPAKREQAGPPCVSVDQAMAVSKHAVRADESGEIDTAITLYTEAVELIKLSLQGDVADSTALQLHRYSRLYSARLELLAEHKQTAAPVMASASLSGSARLAELL